MLEFVENITSMAHDSEKNTCIRVHPRTPGRQQLIWYLSPEVAVAALGLAIVKS